MTIRTGLFYTLLALMPLPFIVLAEEPPPWPSQAPRILFNVNNGDQISRAQIGESTFYMDFWQSPSMTVLFNRWVAGEKGHRVGGKSVHGEEMIHVLKGRLVFVFNNLEESFIVDEGQIMMIPNISHWGTCMTDECLLVAAFTPTRDDFGPEGTPMTEETNAWLKTGAENKESP
ncbi:MAG: hypothetical protein J4A00_04945 [Gammaproteobacteria bacterium]|nr:hypothetical protein [Gammaproteobacteria bacterium]